MTKLSFALPAWIESKDNQNSKYCVENSTNSSLLFFKALSPQAKRKGSPTALWSPQVNPISQMGKIREACRSIREAGFQDSRF